MCRRLHAGLAVFAVTLFTVPTWAQTVRPSSSGYASTIRQSDKAADKQNRTDWPHIIDGDSGTQVHISFNLRNADVTLNTNRAFTTDAVLTEARQIAQRLNLPATDFITFTGSATSNVDMEFNDYLTRVSASQTRYSLDLGTLGAALQASHLPRPLALHIETEDADLVRLIGAEGANRTLTNDTFLNLADIKPGARLDFAVSVPWYSFAAAYLLIGLIPAMLAFVLVLPWWSVWRDTRKPADAAESLATDPTEVQARYNKQKPKWVTHLATTALPLAIVPVIFCGVRALPFVLPQDFSPRTMFVFMPVLFGGQLLSMGASKLYARMRSTAPKTSIKTDDVDAPPQWTHMAFLYPLMGAMALMPLVLFLPGFSLVAAHTRMAIIYGIMTVAFCAAAVIGVRGWRAVRTDLKPGDIWYDRVQQLAQKAGVAVRHVVVLRDTSVNASASVLGTVNLTSALLRKLEPDEVEAVIAHEIGHHKAGHTKKALLIGLFIFAGYMILLTLASSYAKRHFGPYVAALLNSPLPGTILLPFIVPLFAGKAQRRHEEEADRFAVQTTGDPELVIRALRKIHTLNATPHILKPADEALSTHPSLARRIEAIRRAFPETGGRGVDAS